MVGELCDRRPAGGRSEGSPSFLYFAGSRYWTASLLPTIMGTTLPFWLRPPVCSFRWLGAIEFLIATILLYGGFSFLQARFEDRSIAEWPESRLLGAAGRCIVATCLLGLHLNSFVPGSIFIASLPIVVATALWVWTDELITRMDDEKEGRQTMVILFGPRFSG